MSEGPSQEDAKLLTLARGARLRAYAPYRGPAQGAAVRDADGRTYAAATVEHPDEALSTSALQAALAAAYSSGARAFKACAVTGEGITLSQHDAALLGALAAGVPILLAGPDGVVVRTTTVEGDRPPGGPMATRGR